MNNNIVLLTDVKKLKDQLNILNDEYLRLYEKLKDLKKEQEYFESLYNSKLGALIFLRFENEIKYRRLKKKLILIVKSKNKGEEVNIEVIEKALEEELKEFYEELEKLRDSLKDSREFLELPTLTEDEVKRIKEIFRELAKRLHPDVNKNLNETMMDLWFKVQEAYENNDLTALIILQGMVKSDDPEEDIKISSIEENIEELNKKIYDLKRKIDIEENKFPLNIKSLIEDDKYINEKKREITYEIREYKKMINEIEKAIKEVLKEKEYE